MKYGLHSPLDRVETLDAKAPLQVATNKFFNFPPSRTTLWCNNNVAIFRKQRSLWALGDAERARSYHYRESDKLRKMEKQDKLDKEKLKMMDGSDRVKHLEAQMLCKIKAMDLDSKVDLYMEEDVS